MHPPTETKKIILWLYGLIVLILCMVMIGGITRLTGSGLSITEWKPIMGFIPPLNTTDWVVAFDNYQQIPQFKNLNATMNLEEFKIIFFWEYFHRLIGRLIGLYLLVPFLFFYQRNREFRTYFKDFILLATLGGLQGVMGWIMVKSGLKDAMFVSPIRLASHLLLAMALIVWVLFLISKIERRYESFSSFLRSMQSLPLLLLIQCIYGALTAGTHSGFMFPTFPTMNHEWIPSTINSYASLWQNLFINPSTVQWVHRLLGTIILILSLIIWLRKKTIRSLVVLTGLIAQYSFGIAVVSLGVPLWAGMAHQVLGVSLFTLTVRQSSILNNRSFVSDH